MRVISGDLPVDENQNVGGRAHRRLRHRGNRWWRSARLGWLGFVSHQLSLHNIGDRVDDRTHIEGLILPTELYKGLVGERALGLKDTELVGKFLNAVAVQVVGRGLVVCAVVESLVLLQTKISQLEPRTTNLIPHDGSPLTDNNLAMNSSCCPINACHPQSFDKQKFQICGHVRRLDHP